MRKGRNIIGCANYFFTKRQVMIVGLDEEEEQEAEFTELLVIIEFRLKFDK
jgi:hypothetical protein